MHEKLFNPDYLLHLCQKYGLRPSKKYGQNYLINPEVIDHIVEVSELTHDDVVVEVGPGFGVLTLALAEKAGRVISFEIEKKLEPYWNEMLEKERGIHNVEVEWGNVLRAFESYQLSAPTYKVVSNLPYQITSAAIRTFLESAHPPTQMVLMVQKEVAERICAKPGDMSLLAVSVQYYASAEYVCTVPRIEFWPSPQVDSAVVMIRTKEHATRNKVFDEQFFKVVKAGFAQKRKLLTKNLEPVVGKKQKDRLKIAFTELGLAPTARAQELTIDQWKALVTHFKLEIGN